METHRQSPKSHHKTPVATDPDESYDPLYERSFHFAKHHGYGFVHFTKESAEDKPVRRRPFSLYKANVLPLQQNDRRNPVHVKKSASRPLGSSRTKCFEKAGPKEDRELDTMQIIQSVKQDIAMVKEMSTDVETFSRKSPESPQLIRRSKSRNKQRMRRRLKRNSQSKSPGKDDEGELKEGAGKGTDVDMEENIIMSAPLPEYIAYLSRRCSKIWDHQEPEVSTKPVDRPREETKASEQDEASGTDVGKATLLVGEASVSSMKTVEKKAAASSPDYTQHPEQAKSPYRLRKFRRKSRGSRNVSKNSMPTANNSELVDDGQKVLSSPEDKEFERCLKDKPAQHYKLCSSVSSNIFQETQLSQKNQKYVSTKLPVVEIDLICMTDECDGNSHESDDMLSLHTIKRPFNQKPKRLDATQSTAENRSVAHRRCFRRGRSGWYQSQFQRIDVKGITSCRVDGGSCPNLLRHGMTVSRGTAGKAVSRSPTSSCGSNLTSAVGDSPTKSEVVSQSPCDIPSSARGDEGHTGDAIDKRGTVIQPSEMATVSNLPNESAKNRVRIDSPLSINQFDDAQVKCQGLFSYPLQNTGNDGSTSALAIGSPVRYISLRKPVLGREKDTLAEICSTESNHDKRKTNEDHSCFQLEDSEESRQTNTNNNALPQMSVSPDKISVHSERGVSPKRQQRIVSGANNSEVINEVSFHLPVLPGNRASSPQLTSRNNSHCVESSKSSSVPSVSSVPVAKRVNGKRATTRGSKTQSGEKEMDQAKLLELPTISDHSAVGTGRQVGGNTTNRLSKKTLICPSSSSSKTSVATDQNDSYFRGCQKQDTTSESRKVHLLNKSYVISGSEVASDTIETYKDCGSLLPFLRNTAGSHRMPADHSSDSLTPKTVPMEISKLSTTQQNSLRMDRVTTKPENLVMPALTMNAVQNYNFLPKPKISLKSPQFALSTRSDKEDTRRTIGNNPELSCTDASSHDQTFSSSENINNNSNDGETEPTRDLHGVLNVDYPDNEDKSQAENFHSSMKFCVNMRNSSVSAGVNEGNCNRPSRGAVQNDTNSNNCQNRPVHTHTEKCDQIPSSASVGSQLERELLTLMEDDVRESSSLCHFHSCSHRSTPAALHIRHLDSMSDINTSNPTRRLRPHREDAGRGLYRSQGREQEHARRHSTHLSAAEYGIGEEAVELGNQNIDTADQQRRVRFQKPMTEPPFPSRHSVITADRAVHSLPWSGHLQPEHNRQSNGPILANQVSANATTENYWQTAAREPFPTLRQYISQNSEGAFQCRSSNVPMSHLQGPHIPGNVSQVHSQDTEQLNIDDSMDKMSEIEDSVDNNDISPREVVIQTSDLGDLYRRLDEMMMHSQHELIHQLESVNESFSTRLKSLQDLVERRFQRTCSLIQNSNKKDGKRKAAVNVGCTDKTTTAVDTIQLNTAKSRQSVPTFGFPLDTYKYSQESRNSSGTTTAAVGDKEVVKNESSKTSVQTFPTMQFAELTQKSRESLPRESHCHIAVSDSSQNMRREAKPRRTSGRLVTNNRKVSSKSTMRSASTTKGTLRTPVEGRKKRRSSKASRQRSRRAECPRYKSMRQWKDEVNKSITCRASCQSKNRNSRYERLRHSRSCRRRQAFEGTFCNKCLPPVCPVKRTTFNFKGGRCGVRRKPPKTKAMNGILQNPQGRKRGRKSRAKNVRFKLRPRNGKKTRRKKLISPPPSPLWRRSNRSQSKSQGRRCNRCTNNCVFISRWQAARRRRNKTKAPQPKSFKLKHVREADRLRRRAGATKYITGPKGHERLYKIFRWRYETLKRQLSRLGYNRWVNPQPSSTDRIERLVKQFRLLISRYPERRLRTLQDILYLRSGQLYNNQTAARNLTRTSSIRQAGQIFRENKKTSPYLLQNRSERPSMQNHGEATYELSTQITPQNQHHQNLPYTMDHLQFRGHTGNASPLSLMHQRPGFNFFHTVSPVTRPHQQADIASPKDGSGESITGSSSHPRPVDSLNIIRRQLNKTRNTSWNATCLARSLADESYRTDCDKADNRKELFTDQRLSGHTERMLTIEETMEGENLNLSTFTWTNNDEQLGVISLPQVILLRNNSFSSTETNDDQDMNAQEGRIQHTGLPQKRGISHSFQDMNNTEYRCERNENNIRIIRKSPKQETPCNYHPFIKNTAKTILSRENGEETRDCRTDHLSERSDHTGGFKVDTVNTEGTEAHMSSKHSSVFDQLREDTADRADSNLVKPLPEESDHSATAGGSSDIKGSIKTQDRAVKISPSCEKTIPRQPNFTASLWEGFQRQQSSSPNYKRSHLLSFLTDQYRTPPQVVRSSSTCTTRHSHPNLSLVDVTVKGKVDERKNSQNKKSQFNSANSEQSHSTFTAVATSENSSPSRFGAQTENFDPVERYRLRPVHGKIEAVLGLGQENKDIISEQESSQRCQPSSQCQSMINSSQDRSCPTLVLRYRPWEDSGTSHDRASERGRATNHACTATFTLPNFQSSNSKNRTFEPPPEEDFKKSMGSDSNTGEHKCQETVSNDQAPTLNRLTCLNFVHNETERIDTISPSFHLKTANPAEGYGSSQESTPVQSIMAISNLLPVTPVVECSHENCQNESVKAETQSETLADEARLCAIHLNDTNHDQRLQSHTERMFKSMDRNDINMERPVDPPENARAATVPFSFGKVPTSAVEETVAERPVQQSSVLDGTAAMEQLKPQEQGMSSVISAEGERELTHTIANAANSESNNVERPIFRQPYFVVNSPGISTTWVCVVPELPSPAEVFRTRVSTVQNTTSMENENLKHPDTTPEAGQNSMSNERCGSVRNRNQSNAAEIYCNRLTFKNHSEIFLPTSCNAVSLEQRQMSCHDSATCHLATADTFTDAHWVDLQRYESTDYTSGISNETSDGCFAGQHGDNSTGEDLMRGHELAVNSKLCSAISATGSESFIQRKNLSSQHEYPSSKQSKEISGLKADTESAISSRKDSVSDVQLAVNREDIDLTNLPSLTPVHNSEYSSTTYIMTPGQVTPTLSITEPGQNGRRSCSPRLPSSPASRERNNNAVRHNDVTICNNLCRNTQLKAGLSCMDHVCWSGHQDDDGQENITAPEWCSERIQVTDESFGHTHLPSAVSRDLTAPINLLLHTGRPEDPICEQSRRPIFMESFTESSKPAGRKRRAGKHLFQQMSPPRKVLKISSHLPSCQIVCRRRERLRVRRARRQLARELFYLRHRRQDRERGNITRAGNQGFPCDTDALRQKMTSYLSGSDADSESSL